MTCLIWRTCLQLQHLQRCKVILMASNCWLAEQNLAHQPHLNNSKILLAEKYQILGQMVSSMRRKQRKLGTFSVWWDYACNMTFFFNCITDVMLFVPHAETLQQKLSLRAIHKLLKEKTNHSLSQSEVHLRYDSWNADLKDIFFHHSSIISKLDWDFCLPLFRISG